MEYLIIALCLIAYLAIGVLTVKRFHVANGIKYNEDDILLHLFVVVFWPPILMFGSIAYAFHLIFKRIL